MKKNSNKSHNLPSSLSLNNSKIQKKSPLTSVNKKKQKPSTSSNSKISKQHISKSKSKSQPQDYIIIDNNIYCANTHTQRNNYDDFLKKVKKQKQIQRKSFLIKSQLHEKQSTLKKSRNYQNKKKFQKLTPHDLIQTMTIQQKKQMFYKLQQQIKGVRKNNQQIKNVNLKGFSMSQHFNNQNKYALKSQKEQRRVNQRQQNLQRQKNGKKLQLKNPYYGHTYLQEQMGSKSFEQLQNLSQRSQMRKLNSERQRKQKFDILEQKVQSLKMQLMFKWQGQIDKLQQMYKKGKLTQKQKQTKIIMIQKIKDHKLKILDCTKTLFQKILKQQQYQKQHNEQKTNKIQAILQSLHSFPSLQNLQQNYLQKQPNIDHLKKQSKQQINNNKTQIKQKSKQKKNHKQKQFYISSSLSNQALQLSDLINNKISPTKKLPKNNNQSSPLQIVQNNNSHTQFINQFYKSQSQFPLIQGQDDSRIKIFNSENQSIQKKYQQNYDKQNKGNSKKFNSSIRFAQSQSFQQNYQKNQNNLDSHNNEYEQNFSGQQPDYLTGKMLLKLDLRLDQIVFGQDQYPQNQKQIQLNQQQHQNNKQQQGLTSFINQKKIYSQTSFDGQNRFIKQNSLEQIKQSHNFRQFQNPLINHQAENYNSVVNTQQNLQRFNNQNLVSGEQQPKSPQTPNKYSLSSLLKFSTTNKTQQTCKQQKIQSQKKIISSVEVQDPKNTPNSISSPLGRAPSPVSSPSTSLPHSLSHINEQQDQSLVCREQIKKEEKININIPLILTRDKMENLQFEKNKAFRQNMDRRIAFQMGCIQILNVNQNGQSSNAHHFTTLVDINTYIVGFYQFMMRKYLNTLVDNLNIPYGKSVIDKLYSLQAEGYVLQQNYNDMNNILSEGNFMEYQREMMLTMRKCSQYQVAHNRAIFQAFTKCINVYRPYYELEGEVYPWVVSQKGITFYEINQQNIEEVFEKSKIKVLQYCTTLCGLHSPCDLTNDDQKTMINNKWQQNLSKMIKNQSSQEYTQWGVRIVNFECLVKLMVTQSIFHQIFQQSARQINSIFKVDVEQQKIKLKTYFFQYLIFYLCLQDQIKSFNILNILNNFHSTYSSTLFYFYSINPFFISFSTANLIFQMKQLIKLRKVEA